jgi:hypothetical protein
MDEREKHSAFDGGYPYVALQITPNRKITKRE